MSVPPPDPRDSTLVDQPTWRGVLAGYVAIAAFPLLLWVASHPMVGALTVVLGGGLVLVARQAYRLARCVVVCRQVAVDLGRGIRITVTRRCDCEPT